MMSSKKHRRRPPTKLSGPSTYEVPPTRKQVKHHEEMRELRNEAFRLREELEATKAKLEVAERGLDVVKAPPRNAIEKLCKLTVAQAAQAGISRELSELAAWIAEVGEVESEYRTLATGNALASIPTPESKPKPMSPATRLGLGMAGMFIGALLVARSGA